MQRNIVGMCDLIQECPKQAQLLGLFVLNTHSLWHPQLSALSTLHHPTPFTTPASCAPPNACTPPLPQTSAVLGVAIPLRKQL